MGNIGYYYPLLITNHPLPITHIKKPLSISKIFGILRGHKLATNDGEINF